MTFLFRTETIVIAPTTSINKILTLSRCRVVEPTGKKCPTRARIWLLVTIYLRCRAILWSHTFVFQFHCPRGTLAPCVTTQLLSPSFYPKIQVYMYSFTYTHLLLLSKHIVGRDVLHLYHAHQSLMTQEEN